MEFQYGDVYLDTTDGEVFILIAESEGPEEEYITLPIPSSRIMFYEIAKEHLKSYCEYKGNVSKSLKEFADLVRST